MLQALLHKKLKDSFENPHFRPSEDSLTSSVLGLMQYLPDGVFWDLLRSSCGRLSNLPESVGAIISVNFWDRWDATDTWNTNLVEPDVWIDTKDYYIIIEAKEYDASGMQHDDQWENEIKALLNENDGKLDKELIFIALGGNESLLDSACVIDGMECPIHTASWFNMLHAVDKLKMSLEEGHIHRLLTDIIHAFTIHGFFNITWLHTLKPINLNAQSASWITETLEFDNHKIFRGLYRPQNRIKYTNIQLWKK